MGALLGQKKESSGLGMVAPKRLRPEINRSGSTSVNRSSGSRSIRERNEPIKRPTPIKKPAPKPNPVTIDRNKEEENSSGSKTSDLPGHGLPDKKEPQRMQVTSEPDNDSSNASSSNENNSENKQNKESSSNTPAPAEQTNIMKKLQSVDKKVWYGLGGGLALITLIATVK